MEKLCRVCGQPLSAGETRCSYCGTTTEDYKEPKYTSSYYEDNKKYNSTPSQGDYPPVHNSTRVINDYANRPNARVDIRDDSVVIRDGSRDRVYPTRINPQATRTPSKKKNKGLTVILVIVALMILVPFIGAFVSIISTMEDVMNDSYIGQQLLDASKEKVNTEYVDDISDEYVELGEPVKYSTNLYENGKYLIYNTEKYEYLEGDEDDYSDDYFYYREFFVFFNQDYFDNGSTSSDEYTFSYNGDIEVDCSLVNYDGRLEYIYLGDDYTVERKDNFVMNDVAFEVYEVKTSYDTYRYYIYSQPIEEDEWVVEIEIESDGEEVDYLDVFSYIVCGKREDTDSN